MVALAPAANCDLSAERLGLMHFMPNRVITDNPSLACLNWQLRSATDSISSRANFPIDEVRSGRTNTAPSPAQQTVWYALRDHGSAFIAATQATRFFQRQLTSFPPPRVM